MAWRPKDFPQCGTATSSAEGDSLRVKQGAQLLLSGNGADYFARDMPERADHH